MKKIVTIIGGFIASLVSMVIGAANDYPVITYIGVIIGVFLLLALLTWLIQWIAGLFNRRITNSIFLILVCITLVILIANDAINGYIALGSGVFVGVCFILGIIRFLSKRAYKSVIIGEVFSFITGYELKSFIEREKIVPRESKLSEYQDYKNITVLLRDLGLTDFEAKKAARYAVMVCDPDDSLEDKINLAFQYHGNTIEKGEKNASSSQV